MHLGIVRDRNIRTLCVLTHVLVLKYTIPENIDNTVPRQHVGHMQRANSLIKLRCIFASPCFTVMGACTSVKDAGITSKV